MSKTTPKTPAKGRLRRHADAPANWQWRRRPDGTGRPRWIPSPTLRKAGWKPRDLKDDHGQWLTEGASRDAARAINDQVAAWRRGELVSADFAAMAPAGAAEQAQSLLPQAVDRLSIGRLQQAWFDSREFDRLKPSTRRGYRTSLKRLVDVLAGFVALPAADDPDALDRYDMATATIRASRVFIFQPTVGASGVVNLLYTAYWRLHDEVGPHQAYSVLGAASAWLKWCKRHQDPMIQQHWASEVSRSTPPGRIRPMTWAEVKALVEAADRLGFASIGDAVVLGLDLSWSQIDRLQLTWPRLKHGYAFLSEGRAKTGRVGGTPLTRLGRARVAQILRRQRAMGARPTHVLWCEVTNAPWTGDLYRKKFALVRAEGARACPSVATATDADLRDTAFTWMKNAGISDDGIASRTIQSRKHIAQLGDANYGEIGPAIANPARDLYEAELDRIGAWL